MAQQLVKARHETQALQARVGELVAGRAGRSAEEADSPATEEADSPALADPGDDDLDTLWMDIFGRPYSSDSCAAAGARGPHE